MRDPEGATRDFSSHILNYPPLCSAILMEHLRLYSNGTPSKLLTRFDSIVIFYESPKGMYLRENAKRTGSVKRDHPEPNIDCDTRDSGNHILNHATSCSAVLKEQETHIKNLL